MAASVTGYQRLGGEGVQSRQEDGQRRAIPRLALAFDPPSVVANDAVDGGQPQTRRPASLLGREEWFENAFARVRLHADTVVDDKNASLTPSLD